MAVTIFIGNLLTCIVFLSKTRLRETYMNVFLISLAVSDFLVSILVFPGYTTVCSCSCVTAVRFRHCKLLEGIKDYVLLVNVFNILCITFDRYVAVLQPLNYNSKINKSSSATMLVCAWTIPLPLAYMKPLLVAVNEEIFRQKVNRSIYDIVAVIVFIMIPMCIIVAVNGLIINVIRKQTARINPLGNTHSNTSNIESDGGLESHMSLKNNPRQLYDDHITQHQPPVSRDNLLAVQDSTLRESRYDNIVVESSSISVEVTLVNYDVHHDNIENGNNTQGSRDNSIVNGPINVENYGKQTTMSNNDSNNPSLRPMPAITTRLKTLTRQIKDSSGTRSCLAVSAIFVVCWIPWSLFNVLRPFSRDVLHDVHLIEKISLLFLYFQSMTNPFVYSLYRKDFREAAKDLLNKLR
ncbi:D(2) dopamine receptor A-like [Exaiptasia diaphana]|uniref:G-protein coupled receptors family 1 profile domain-containing protein n=1 Tax=Exaiptasia diaphana TaxID=2652724 RepID=A0A913Y2S0_EXADI|nr:D(2) dopamine receptor A-like [Exaiptasia diaphana]